MWITKIRFFEWNCERPHTSCPTALFTRPWQPTPGPAGRRLRGKGSALGEVRLRLDSQQRVGSTSVTRQPRADAQRSSRTGHYDNLLNNLGNDEAVLFADAVHPTHEVRPAGCWAPKDAKVALEQTSGRQRLNIHGAIDLETGATRMIEATTIDALSSIALLIAITLMYPTKRLIHVFLDNAGYHHAVLVQE